MDDILQFLLIGGMLIVGIVKQFKKESRKEAENRPFVPVEEDDADAEVLTVPADWDRTYDGFIPESPEPQTPPVVVVKKGNRSSAPVAVSPDVPVLQEADAESEYSIRSVEEARKAIIWSEILQRKY